MFITLEGPEGSGKTSHIPPLVEYLREKGHTVFPTREPGGTSIGEQIREVIHDLKNVEMHPRTETLLYQAARSQIVEQVIKPRLALGEIVLSDRYYDSTIAYQGYGHQQDLEQVRALVKYATGGLVPDLTILLDVDVEEGLRRKKQNNAEWNRMDDHAIQFYQRVRAGYLVMVKQEPKRWVVVDSGQKWESVQEELRNCISTWLLKEVREMKDSLKYGGYWWLPETPENKIFGQFTFIPGDELTLKVQGILNIDSDKSNIFSPDFINPQFIHGVIQDESNIEKNVTIYQCHQMGSSMSGSGLQSSSFMGSTAFIGVHFDTVEQLEFRSISVHFSNMELWVNRNPISTTSSDNNAERTIQYNSQDSAWAKTDDMEVKIVFHGPITSYSFIEATISYETRVEITQLQETKFEKYVEAIRQLQNFFSLAMGAATYPIGLIGQSNANKVISESKKEIFLPIDIYYLASSWPKQIKHIHSNEMLFTLTAIVSDFEKCIQNWIKKYELLKPAINLYFSVLYNPSNFAEVKFLSLSQAIETYHRRLFDGKYQNDDMYRLGLYNELVKVVPKELDSDFRKSLQGRLKYGNEYSLRTRLRKVIEGITDILDFSFIQSKPERATFINKVVDTRNYWTHYTSELAEKAVQTGEERLILITQLQLLLEVCFLTDLGFDASITSNLIKRSYRYKLLKSKGV